jgi:ferrochelatase
MKQAARLVAHGTVDDLEELPAFVARIRRGHPAPPELLTELRCRYEAIGGKSPLNAINARLAVRLEEALGIPVRFANRLARPFEKDVLAELVASGVERVAVLPLAQYSAHVYADSVRAAAKELAGGGEPLAVVTAPSWGQTPELLAAYADSIDETIRAIPASERERATLVVSAHSLPVAVVRGGDPYEREFRAAAEAVAALVVARTPVRHVVAFQSQGMSSGPGGKPMEWLGPDLVATIDASRARGDAHVIFAPIGFLADHVEILYDLDIEARAWVEARGMAFHRTRSLNDSAPLVRVLTTLAAPLLATSGARELGTASDAT